MGQWHCYTHMKIIAPKAHHWIISRRACAASSSEEVQLSWPISWGVPWSSRSHGHGVPQFVELDGSKPWENHGKTLGKP